MLEKAGLKLNGAKSHIAAKSVTFLGHQITKNGIQACGDKIEKMVNVPVPKTTKQVKSFVSLVNFYRRYIETLAKWLYRSINF